MFQGTGRKVCVLIKGFNRAIKKHAGNLFTQSSGLFLTWEQRVLTHLAPRSRPGEKRSRTQAHLLSGNCLEHIWGMGGGLDRREGLLTWLELVGLLT